MLRLPGGNADCGVVWLWLRWWWWCVHSHSSEHRSDGVPIRVVIGRVFLTASSGKARGWQQSEELCVGKVLQAPVSLAIPV